MAKSLCYIIKARIQGMSGDDWRYYNSMLDNWVQHISIKSTTFCVATRFKQMPSDERLGEIFKLRRAPNIVDEFGNDANITEAQILVYNTRGYGKLEDKITLSSDDIIRLTGGHHFEESTKLKENSMNCWDDWYKKLMKLSSQDDDAEAMAASIENLDEIHDRIGAFKNADESDIEQINLALDCLAGASDYELYTAFEEMCDYFGFNELSESANTAFFEGVLKESFEGRPCEMCGNPEAEQTVSEWCEMDNVDVNCFCDYTGYMPEDRLCYSCYHSARDEYEAMSAERSSFEGDYQGDDDPVGTFLTEELKTKPIKEATKEFKSDPYSLLWMINDAGYKCKDDDIHWHLDDFYSNFDHYLKDDVHSWGEFISESEYDVDRIENYCTELKTNPGATKKVKELANQILGCINLARSNIETTTEKAEELKDPKNIVKAIEAANIDDVISAYQVGKNIYVDLDTEDEDEAEDIASQIEFDILNNGRKHGRDDLQGMGQWHINVGTLADFSEDDYDDLDEDARDMYQIIIEPAESYKTRRQYDGY